MKARAVAMILRKLFDRKEKVVLLEWWVPHLLSFVTEAGYV